MPDPKFNPGDPLSKWTAEDYRDVVKRIEGWRKVSGAWPIVVDGGHGGQPKRVGIDHTHGFYARLSGSSSPYSFTEESGDVGGGWTSRSGARTGTTNAYEVNAVASLNGKVVWVEPGFPGDYRFQWAGVVAAGNCTWVVNVNDCYARRSGVTVTVTHSGGSSSGTTNGAGTATITGLPTGSATATTTAPSARWLDTSVVRTLATGTQTNTINMTPNVAGGYACAGTFGCGDPIPTTLSGIYYHIYPGDTVVTPIPITFSYSHPYWLSNWFDTGAPFPGLEYRVRLGLQTGGGGSWNVGSDARYSDGTPIYTANNSWGASIRTANSCNPFILDMVRYHSGSVIINGSLYVYE